MQPQIHKCKPLIGGSKGKPWERYEKQCVVVDSGSILRTQHPMRKVLNHSGSEKYDFRFQMVITSNGKW